LKILESLNSLEKIHNALKTNLGMSIPFLEDITQHILASNQDLSRSSFLIQCAEIFRDPDQKIIDVGTTLEFLHSASLLHRHINEFENARRHQMTVKRIIGSEASVLIGDYLLSISFKILARLGNLDVLECVSLATKNISRGQVLELSEPNILATPKHWYKVIRYKMAGLFGAGAQCAAYWGNASKETASKLFSFGEHFGIAFQLKKDLNTIFDRKIIQQKLKNKEFWSPLCFLIHECMNERESIKIIEKLKNEFDNKEMAEEIFYQFKNYDLNKKLRILAISELKEAESFLSNLKIDTTNIQPLTIYSNI